MSTSKADYEALRSRVAAVSVPRDAVSVSGSEAESYLQGQLTQDVSSLAVGDSALSFILQPHGKVDALVRVVRMAHDRFVLDTDPHFGGQVVERLNRFKLRTKVSIEPQADWTMLAVRGSDASMVAQAAEHVSGIEMSAQAHWRGLEGVDLFGSSLEPSGNLYLADADAFETIRIECGVPAMGNELDEKTIPAEAGVNATTIDFRKGCYVGQELVARIDARGNHVPRNLVGVLIDLEEAPPRGTRLIAPDRSANTKPWGVLTSTSWSPGFGKAVALAYVRREVSADTGAMLDWDEGVVDCRIVSLPMVPGSS